jgi:hypothetical protein
MTALIPSQQMCDSNSVEHAAIQFGALLVLQETDRDVPQSDLAETLLLMMMPKKNHTKSSFWRDPKVGLPDDSIRFRSITFTSIKR